MGKSVSKVLKFFLFVAAFCAAVWLFLPWRQVGEAALFSASRQLESRGMKLSFSGVEGIDGGFRVEGLSLSGFMRFSCQLFTLKPQLFSSLLTMAPVCAVSFKDAEMVLGQRMHFGDGSTVLTASPENVLLERLRTDGDFSVDGFIAVDPGQMRISRADASIKVPDSFSENMETLTTLLPLVKERNGLWFLRRVEEKPSK